MMNEKEKDDFMNSLKALTFRQLNKKLMGQIAPPQGLKTDKEKLNIISVERNRRIRKREQI